jgi:hypothetical protein
LILSEETPSSLTSPNRRCLSFPANPSRHFFGRVSEREAAFPEAGRRHRSTPHSGGPILAQVPVPAQIPVPVWAPRGFRAALSRTRPLPPTQTSASKTNARGAARPDKGCGAPGIHGKKISGTLVPKANLLENLGFSWAPRRGRQTTREGAQRYEDTDQKGL